MRTRFSQTRNQSGSTVKTTDYSDTRRAGFTLLEMIVVIAIVSILAGMVVQMEDAETGNLQLVNTHSKKVRSAYGKYHRERVDYFKETFTKSGCGILSCRVDESYVKKLLGYFKRRG